MVPVWRQGLTPVPETYLQPTGACPLPQPGLLRAGPDLASQKPVPWLAPKVGARPPAPARPRGDPYLVGPGREHPRGAGQGPPRRWVTERQLPRESSDTRWLSLGFTGLVPSQPR